MEKLWKGIGETEHGEIREGSAKEDTSPQKIIWNHHLSSCFCSEKDKSGWAKKMRQWIDDAEIEGKWRKAERIVFGWMFGNMSKIYHNFLKQ